MSGDEQAKPTTRSRSTTARPKGSTKAKASAAPKVAAKADAAPKAAAKADAATNGSGTGFQPPVYAGLRQRYHDEVVPALQRDFSYANPMEIPRLDKVVVNIGLGEAIANAKALDAAVGDLATITGQKPIVTRAKRSIAQFRLRTGMPIGAKVTLRGQHMYQGQTQYLPLKVTMAGVIPIIFAISILAFPGQLAAYFSFSDVEGVRNIALAIGNFLSPTTIQYSIIYFALTEIGRAHV